MNPSSADVTIQQRVLSHTGALGYCLRVLQRLPSDTVLVAGYSDGHTTIPRITLTEIENLMASHIEQLEAESERWQQPAFGTTNDTTASADGAAEG